MAKASKRIRAIREKLEVTKTYTPVDAAQLLKDVSTVKFDESVEISVNLGIDPRKSDQNVRGSVVMPHGTGKTVRVAVFAQGDKAELAKAAGADVVGFEDLAEDVKAGNMDFDMVIATPDAMRVVGSLGTILGPRGLMPNPKVGTVTPDVEQAVKNAKAGQVQYRAEKAGIVHCSIGKLSFAPDALKENLETLIAALRKSKPSTAKGAYIKRVAMSSTMGPGLNIDTDAVDAK